ncbi:MAG: hypothetical protein H0T63_01715 [Pyrinomonadaceae bacterium]|nr:hypothetical protein [Pyrinomonadaceae bacterium]
MATYEDQWFEVWFTEGTDIIPGYLLIVTPDESRTGCIVIDPQQNQNIIFRGRDYEETKNWLLEDEYSLVRGREFPDDGWPLQTK